MKKFYLTLIAIALFSYSFAQQVNSVAVSTGNPKWNQSTSWSLGHVPVSGETVEIPAGRRISLETHETYGVLHLRVYGALNIKGGSVTLTDASSVVNVYTGGEIRTQGSQPAQDVIRINNVIKFQGSLTYAGPGSGQGLLAGPAYASSSTGTGTSGFVFGSVLPVTLVDLKATTKGSGVLISWKTSQEKNSSNFIVQRSKNAIEWTDLGSVKAQGNSSILTEYLYTDARPMQGRNFYRLKMTDIDGSVKYSAVIAANMKSTAVAVSIYPNPAITSARVSIDRSVVSEELNVTLIDRAGRLIVTKKLNSDRNYLDLDLRSLPDGSYVIVADSGKGFRQTKSLVIAKN